MADPLIGIVQLIVDQRCKACLRPAISLSPLGLCHECSTVDEGLTRFLNTDWGRRRVVQRYRPDLSQLANDQLIEVCDDAAQLIDLGRLVEARSLLSEVTGAEVVEKVENS